MPVDPIARFKRWFAQAKKARIPLYERCALATADRRGRPSVRLVLLKQVDKKGFVFFTNGRSRKGKDLRENPYGSMVFYWHKLNKQVRVEGKVKKVTPHESNLYWATRPRESNLGALASDQSSPIVSRTKLVRQFNTLRQKYRGKALPRPPHWTGFRIEATAIEFWTQGPHRLHYRERFEQKNRKWKKLILQP